MGTKQNLSFAPGVLWLALAMAAAAAIYAPFLPIVTSDLKNFVTPWLTYLREHDGFAAIGHEFSEYAPPYLYILAILSYFRLPLSDVVLIKLINLPFLALACYAVYLLCRHFKLSRNAALAAAGGLLLVPTVGINAFVWGQADIIYTSILLFCVYFALTRQPIWSMAAFGLAFSIKLQGIFLAPFILMAVLRGLIPWRATLAVPVVYFLTLAPMGLAGRSWIDLFLIYAVQGSFYHQLSLHAPNIYFLLDEYLKVSAWWIAYKLITLVGLIIASITGAAIALIGLGRKHLSDNSLLIIATLTLLAMPYVIPKMHDRYFFPADVFAFVLAVVDPRFRYYAAAVQLSSLFSYTFVLNTIGLPGTLAFWDIFVTIAVFLNFAAIVWALYILRGDLGRLISPAQVLAHFRNMLKSILQALAGLHRQPGSQG